MAPLVAVVDDDISVRESLDSLIRSVGLAVKLFVSAEEFVNSDRSLQGGLSHIGRAPAGDEWDRTPPHLMACSCNVPVIFITAHASDDRAKSEAASDWTVAYLIKPFGEDELLDAVEAALKWKAAEHEQLNRSVRISDARVERGDPMNDTGALVYVVDDDASAREGLAGLIRSAGLMARRLSQGRNSWLPPRPNLPSCLVLDVNLPGLNGLDLQQEIAKSGPQVPIIFLTGHGDIPMTVRALKAGAANFLTKPVDDEALLDAIQHCISSLAGRRDPVR